MVTKVNSKEEFVKFISDLINDLKNNPDSWENLNLEDYLVAMQSWLEDVDGWEQNTCIHISDMNVWKLMANILYVAKIYE
jgi:hypothetical protein